MTNYYNRLEAKEKRRRLRSSETAAEALLWERLRDRQVGGLKFRRQYSVGIYIVDFYCVACRLAVELDGETHASVEAQEYDAERTSVLTTLDIRVIGSPNASIYQDINLVISRIEVASSL